MSYEMKGTVKRLFDVWKSDTSEFYKREFVVTTAEQYHRDSLGSLYLRCCFAQSLANTWYGSCAGRVAL